MSKKKRGFGRYIMFAVVAGAAAAGISYFTKYKSFHKELEEDFHDFEDDDEPVDSTMNRNYVPISQNAEGLKHEPVTAEASASGNPEPSQGGQAAGTGDDHTPDTEPDDVMPASASPETEVAMDQQAQETTEKDSSQPEPQAVVSSPVPEQDTIIVEDAEESDS